MQVFTRNGWVWVNPYATLVASYERLIGGRGREIKPGDPVQPTPDKPPMVLHTSPATDASAKTDKTEQPDVSAKTETPVKIIKPAPMKKKKKPVRRRRRHRVVDDAF
jgi:hypothetical protein